MVLYRQVKFTRLERRIGNANKNKKMNQNLSSPNTNPAAAAGITPKWHARLTVPIVDFTSNTRFGKFAIPCVCLLSLWTIFSSNPANYFNLDVPSSSSSTGAATAAMASSSSLTLGLHGSDGGGDHDGKGLLMNHEPSHLRLCRALLNRTSLVVEERSGVCHDAESPFTSLVQIFSSALVGHIGGEFGLRYRHSCTLQKRGKKAKVAAVQQYLPEVLSMGDFSDEDYVMDACQSCINRMDYDEILKVKGVDYHHLLTLLSLDCLLFPQQEPPPLPETESEPEAVPSRRRRRDRRRRLQTDATVENASLMSTIFPSIQTHLRDAAASYNTKTGNNKKNDDDSAVVYIACTKERTDAGDCDLMVMPMYVYALDLPRSVSSVSIIVSSNCASNSLSCSMYADALKSFLVEVYPRSDVSMEIVTGSASTYAKMMSARYLFCTPGVSCLFAALGKKGYASIVESPTLYPWLNDLSADVMERVRVYPAQTVVSAASTTLDSIMKASPPTHICSYLHGRAGNWVQDMEYARGAQYSLPLLKYAGTADLKFQPTKDNLYRKPTTWKWVDSAFKTCQIQLVNLDNMCKVLQALGITRIFFLGDSLQFQMAQSLWKLLDLLDDLAEDKASAAKRQVICPQTQFEFTFEFARNDRLLDVDTGPAHAKDKNCKYGYCWPWTQKYLDNTARTLVIANTGAHSHEHSIFNEDFDTFVQLVDRLRRPRDFVYFRTSVPGHMNCGAADLEPFKNYAEYKPTITEVYSWNKFIDYNDYATRVLDERNRDEKEKTNVMILDVYPMTVLRQDGHSGGADCIGCDNKDCLHYSLPGPVDWWNHLLYTDLAEKARRYIKKNNELEK